MDVFPHIQNYAFNLKISAVNAVKVTLEMEKYALGT